MWILHLAALALSFILQIQVIIAQENHKCLPGKAATQLLDLLKAAFRSISLRLSFHQNFAHHASLLQLVDWLSTA